MNKLLDICYEYSESWGFEYGPTKCAVMVFNESKQRRAERRRDRIFMMGPHKLKEVDEYCHLGVLHQIDKNNSIRTDKHVGKAKKELNAMSVIGICPGGLDPLVGTKLYWRVCIPTLLYGCEVWVCQAQDVEKLELYHRQAAKRIQWLPQIASNNAVLATLGWIQASTEIEKRKLMFLGSMCRMEEESIFKQILTYRYNDISSRTTNECAKSNSLVQTYMNLLRKYQLENVFDEWIKSDMVISKYRWKRVEKRFFLNMFIGVLQ